MGDETETTPQRNYSGGKAAPQEILQALSETGDQAIQFLAATGEELQNRIEKGIGEGARLSEKGWKAAGAGLDNAFSVIPNAAEAALKNLTKEGENSVLNLVREKSAQAWAMITGGESVNGPGGAPITPAKSSADKGQQR